jgi:hypothetical protein
MMERHELLGVLDIRSELIFHLVGQTVSVGVLGEGRDCGECDDEGDDS